MTQNDFRLRMKPSRTYAVLLAVLMAVTFTAVAQDTNLSSALDYPAFKIIAERNIFNQNRMPHERAAQPTRVPDSFALVGTLFYAGGDIAFFNGTSDEFRKALKVGGDIAAFKVAAMTLNSVTLSDGTNQMVLKVTMQMRRDDDGHWAVSTAPVSYSSTAGATSEAAYSSRSRHFQSTRSYSTVMTGAEAANDGADNLAAPGMEDNLSTATAPGGANSALEKLMQRRAQEEQQIRQGQ